MRDADYWIERLRLAPHPEGGYYREIYRSECEGAFTAFEVRRSVATSIYFLLTRKRPSFLHRLRQEEIWSYHAGADIDLHLFDPEARSYRRIRVGCSEGAEPQGVVPAGCWFAATLAEEHGIEEPDLDDGQSIDSYALAGCIVVPGFRFADFTLGKSTELLPLFPDQADLVRKLCADLR